MQATKYFVNNFFRNSTLESFPQKVENFDLLHNHQKFSESPMIENPTHCFTYV